MPFLGETTCILRIKICCNSQHVSYTKGSRLIRSNLQSKQLLVELLSGYKNTDKYPLHFQLEKRGKLSSESYGTEPSVAVKYPFPFRTSTLISLKPFFYPLWKLTNLQLIFILTDYSYNQYQEENSKNEKHIAVQKWNF